jgi:hypothetical protein
MSSWSGGRQILAKKIRPGLYFQAREAGFCSLFLDYFYHYLFAQHAGQALHVNCTPNPVGANYELFRETFQTPVNVEFVRDYRPAWTHIQPGQIRQRMANISTQQLQNFAQLFFHLTPEMASEVSSLLTQQKTPEHFDIGVHIRSGDKITTGEMPVIPISAYRDQIKKFCTSPSPMIFVMTDNIETLESLKAIAEPGWRFFALTQDRQRGHVQLDFNLSPSSQRRADYIQFLAELELMRRASSLVVTFTSNIGRYLYLTAPTSTSIVSIDMKVFAPI